MKKIIIHQTDAFTDKLFGGNPAGVVFDADNFGRPGLGKITLPSKGNKSPLITGKGIHVFSGEIHL